MEQVSIVLVDDEVLVRAGLKLLLDGAQGLSVVGEAGNGREALEEIARHQPDVVLMDIRMPVMTGIEALTYLPPDGPAVVILTAFDTADDIVAALRAGAKGFLRKTTSPESMVAAVHAAAEGQTALNPEIVATLVGESKPRARDHRHRLNSLSKRETEIAAMIAEGLTNEEIGRRLFLAVPTVKTHIGRIMEKLDALNRVQIAVMYSTG